MTTTRVRPAVSTVVGAVAVCAAGAVLVLIATGRTWAVDVTVRPQPLPELRTEHSGGALVPWLPALGWVTLAGAGALVATRATLRRVVGVLLVVAGVAVVAGAGWALVDAGAAPLWPVLCAVGGSAVAAVGAVTAARGAHWPAMGARYERRPARPGSRSSSSDQRTEQVWDALDRGQDPTA